MMMQTKYKNYILMTAMFLLINLCFWLTAQHFGLNRVVINLDYILLGLFLYYKHRLNTFLFFVTFFIICLVEILLFTLQVFPFIGLHDILYLSGFIFNGPVLYVIVLFACIFAIIFSFYLLNRFFVEKIVLEKKVWLTIMGLSLSMFIVLSTLDNKSLNSQTYFFVKNRSLSMIDIMKGGNVIEPLNLDYASKTLLAQTQQKQLKSDKILFIVSESWSETAQPEQQQAILKAIYAQKEKYAFIQQGSFTAIGATVMGEVRELCQKRLLVMDTKRVPAEAFKHCLPNLLKQQGYETYSIYAGSEGLYSPEYWYPLAGLDNRYFYKDLPEGGECKYHNARCDILLVDKVKTLLLSSQKSFVYWLTINTHAPYDDKIFIDGFDCEAVGLKTGTAVCNNYKLHYQFFSALAKMLEDPELKGVEIYVVGDHPAPITDFRDGLKAFKGADVAWLHLKIKGES